MNPESIRVLYDYSYWAFERVWNGDETDYGLNFTM